MSAITPTARSENAAVLMETAGNGKDDLHRLRLFVHWLDTTGRSWATPDLVAYRDYLSHERQYPHPRSGKLTVGLPLSPTSQKVHLSTIRAHYAALLRSNAIRDMLYNATPPAASAGDKKAFVDEALKRLENAIHPAAAPVTVTTDQDRPDSAQIRLTVRQASALLAAPRQCEQPRLAKLRDTALIALMLCTGVREAELCSLEVADLRQRFGSELALHVRHGKGAKQRLIPYGELAFCLAYVDAWLEAAAISSGPVFRGIRRGGKRIRATHLTPRSVQYILKAYPVMVDGKKVTVAPHDLRRTYARRLYDAGVNLVAIQQNLGHADHQTTLGYIGTLDASARQPPAIYEADLTWLGG